jgi:hypothetical protein
MKRGCAGLLHATAPLGDGVVKKGRTALVSFCFAVLVFSETVVLIVV